MTRVIPALVGLLLTCWVLANAQGAVRDPDEYFFDLEGEQVARYTGATRDAQEFLWLGEYAAEGIYREKSFTRYLREKKKQQGTH